MDSKRIRSHRELDVYKMSFRAAMKIYDISKSFPPEEKYSLTDQVRRSSRSVSSNISEAFRKRKYPNAFVAKLSDSEAEAAETQTWLDFSLKCHYISPKQYAELNNEYENIIGKLVNMSLQPEKWKF
ncbi:MAG: four helix bundle protein [Candidatus Woykebacteria bacterium]